MRPSKPTNAAGAIHSLINDYSGQCTTWAKPALSLRLGPQIQTLLSRQGRPTGSCRAGQDRSRRGCSIARVGHVGYHPGTEAPNAPALEGDHFSWVRPAHADTTQGRQLGTAAPWGCTNPVSVHPVCRSWRSFGPSVCLSVRPSSCRSVLEAAVFDGACLGHRPRPDRRAS